MNNNLFKLSNHQIYLITTATNHEKSGMIATWVMPASFAKGHTRSMIAFTKGNHTTSLIQKTKSFVVHLLSEKQLDLLPLFGGYSSKDRNKFENLTWQTSPKGHPIIDGCCGWLEMEVRGMLDGGDRLLVVADGLAGDADLKSLPLFKNQAFARLSEKERVMLEKKYDSDSERDAKAFSTSLSVI